MKARTWYFDIAETECKELLAATPLGRLGVIVNGRPEIFPVNHAYDAENNSIVFPTNGRTKMHAALDWPWVAYEIDGAEADDQSADDGGWSVSVVGHAEEITDPAEIRRAAGRRHASWAASETSHWIRIVPSKMTGRRIRGNPSAE